MRRPAMYRMGRQFTKTWDKKGPKAAAKKVMKISDRPKVTRKILNTAAGSMPFPSGKKILDAASELSSYIPMAAKKVKKSETYRKYVKRPLKKLTRGR